MLDQGQDYTMTHWTMLGNPHITIFKIQNNRSKQLHPETTWVRKDHHQSSSIYIDGLKYGYGSKFGYGSTRGDPDVWNE